MEEFIARPAAIRGAAADIEHLGGMGKYITSIAAADVSVTSNSDVLVDASREFERVQTALLDAYGPTGPYGDMMEGAAQAMRSIAKEYETVDADSAARLDSLLPDLGGVPSYFSLDSPGIDESSYAEIGNDIESVALDQYDDFMKISKTINHIIDCKWVGDILETVGIPNEIAKVEVKLGTEWDQVGVSVAAIDQCRKCMRSFAGDLTGVWAGLEGKWQGRAAASAHDHFNAVARVLRDHANGLGALTQRIIAEMHAVKSSVDTMNDLLEQLIQELPGPQSFSELFSTAIEDGLDEPFKKLLQRVKMFKTAFDVALTMAFGLNALFAQLCRFNEGVDFPPVPTWDAPDVNGRAR